MHFTKSNTIALALILCAAFILLNQVGTIAQQAPPTPIERPVTEEFIYEAKGSKWNFNKEKNEIARAGKCNFSATFYFEANAYYFTLNVETYTRFTCSLGTTSPHTVEIVAYMKNEEYKRYSVSKERITPIDIPLNGADYLRFECSKNHGEVKFCNPLLIKNEKWGIMPNQNFIEKLNRLLKNKKLLFITTTLITLMSIVANTMQIFGILPLLNNNIR